jgi:tetratricopeptide (TPR) repeat protein
MPAGVAGLDGNEPIATEEIRAELERILASDIFRSAPQLTAFLTFVVEQTLAGRAGELKGYTIAVEAFGRPPEFDPQSDPIVRVEAGRLRKALNLYFAAEGIDDPLRITIPVGAYVPSFARLPAVPAAVEPEPAADLPAESALQAARPSRLWLYAACAALLVALTAIVTWHLGRGDGPQPPEPSGALAPAPPPVTPLAPPPAASVPPPEPAATPASLPVVSVVVAETTTDPSLDDVTRTFVRHLVDTMARFDDLVVVRSPGPSVRPEEGADYVLSLTGSRLGDTVEGSIRLSTAKDGRIVWTTFGERSLSWLRDGAGLRDAAQRLAVRFAQPFGILHADLRLASLSPAMACMYQALNFRRHMKAEEHLAARNCLEALVARDPDFHPAWSQLALLTLDEYASGLNTRPGPVLDRALAAAVNAVRLAPSSARAHQAMMDVQFLRGATDEAIKSGREALSRNPYDPEVLADLGARYVQLNRPAEGLPLLERAVELGSGRPSWYDFFLFLAAYLTGADKLAETHAALIRADETPLALIGRAMASAGAGDQIGLAEALRLLGQNEPLFELDSRLYLARRGFSPAVSGRILDAIGRSGQPPR